MITHVHRMFVLHKSCSVICIHRCTRLTTFILFSIRIHFTYVAWLHVYVQCWYYVNYAALFAYTVVLVWWRSYCFPFVYEFRCMLHIKYIFCISCMLTYTYIRLIVHVVFLYILHDVYIVFTRTHVYGVIGTIYYIVKYSHKHRTKLMAVC